jgi:hypothetical protein
MQVPLSVSPAIAVVGCALAALPASDAGLLESLITDLLHEERGSNAPLVSRLTDVINEAYIEP